MNILFVSQFNKHAKQGGGEAIIAFQQAQSLVANGHEVAMITHGDTNTTFFDDQMGLTFIHLETRGEAPFGYMPLTPNQFAYIEKAIVQFNPDVIHAHTMSYLAVAIQGIALKHTFKFVYTTHELPDKLVEFFRYGKWLQQLSSFFVGALVKAFLVNTDKVLAINQASKQSTLNLSYQGQIDIVYNGVDVDLYKTIPLQSPDQKAILYFVGQISARKNQGFLVAMLEFLPSSYQLVLIGAADEQYLRQIQEIASQIKVSERVTYMGQIQNQDLPQTVAGFHCFLSASKIEVQSVAVIEALAAARPIVALQNETVDDFTQTTAVKVLPQTATPKLFAQAVLEMLQDQTAYLKAAQQAREIAARYSKEQAYLGNLKAYQSTVLSASRNVWAYRIPMGLYVVAVGFLFRVKQLLNLFGFWKS